MIKLYILSIIFCLGGMYLGTRRIPNIIKKLNVEIDESKINDREWIKLTRIVSIIPIFNIIVGISFLLFFTGKFDDKVIEKLNKNKLQ